jgi:hypothetical protein
MTAEIAIANKTAIALAADSKVTLSNGGQQKTYDTVDKIFSLSKTEPVGAMIYGSADFMGFPWETILKEYRRRNPTKVFSTIFDWAADLKSFLLSFFTFNAEDDERMIRRVGGTAVEQITRRYFAFLQRGLNSEEIFAGLVEEVDLHLANLETAEDFVSAADWATMIEQFEGIVPSIAKNGYFDDIAGLDERLERLVELSVRKNVSSPSHSGLVVAGFGEDELLPSLIAFEIDGVLAGNLKCIENSKFDATRQNHGLIQPFAQSDMVHRFMSGVDPDYAVQLAENITAMLNRTIVDTAKALGHSDEEITALGPAFAAAVEESMKAFWQADKGIRWERFAQPIIDMTMSLPKDELAHLAESLVSLTSLQRRVSRQIETVGGAIDVAVISKGDGFIWVKRKHYFSADRNIRFVSGYFSEYGKNQPHGDSNGNA